MLWRHLARDLTRRLPDWDASSKLSLGIALTLLLCLLALGFFGPSPLRLPARIGGFGLLISLQLLFLWGNRRDISPYHQAQRHFIAGDYQAARDLLESTPDRGRASVDALVLLGASYRNLGEFDLCESALRRALAIKPDHALCLFSLGKLRLALGEYQEARDCFERAIDAGAPEIVRFELGQASYLLGDEAAALTHLQAARAALAEDPAPLLLLSYYLRELKAETLPGSSIERAHVDFWRRERAKYAETPYGKHLAECVARLEALL